MMILMFIYIITKKYIFLIMGTNSRLTQSTNYNKFSLIQNKFSLIRQSLTNLIEKMSIFCLTEPTWIYKYHF